MNSFKVGDRVLSEGVKCFVISVRDSRITNHKILKVQGGNGFSWSDRSDWVKPIKTCYATLGKTGV